MFPQGGDVNQRFKNFLAGGVLALAPFGTATAGPLEDGQAAYQKGDYATALKIYRLLAEQGNASAKTALGVIYEHGQGVPQDFVRAVIWYSEAAYQGDPRRAEQPRRDVCQRQGRAAGLRPGRRVVPPGR